MKALARLWSRYFLPLELATAALLTIGFVVWMERYGGSASVHQLLSGNRGAVYGALASIFGSLLGFVLAAVAIVLGYSQSERLEVIRNSKHYPTLWKVFSSSMRALGLATVAALLALVADRDSDPFNLLLYFVAFAGLLATLRVLRAIWVVEQIIVVVTTLRPGEVAAQASGRR